MSSKSLVYKYAKPNPQFYTPYPTNISGQVLFCSITFQLQLKISPVTSEQRESLDRTCSTAIMWFDCHVISEVLWILIRIVENVDFQLTYFLELLLRCHKWNPDTSLKYQNHIFDLGYFLLLNTDQATCERGRPPYTRPLANDGLEILRTHLRAYLDGILTVILTTN